MAILGNLPARHLWKPRGERETKGVERKEERKLMRSITSFDRRNATDKADMNTYIHIYICIYHTHTEEQFK